jgi:hypothetical protein
LIPLIECAASAPGRPCPAVYVHTQAGFSLCSSDSFTFYSSNRRRCNIFPGRDCHKAAVSSSSLNGRLISGFFSVCQVKEMDGRTCVCCVFYQWAGGDRVTRKKKRHFYLILFVSYFYLTLGKRRRKKEKRFLFFLSSGDFIAFSKHTSIPPAPIPFLYT